MNSISILKDISALNDNAGAIGENKPNPLAALLDTFLSHLVLVLETETELAGKFAEVFHNTITIYNNSICRNLPLDHRGILISDALDFMFCDNTEYRTLFIFALRKGLLRNVSITSKVKSGPLKGVNVYIRGGTIYLESNPCNTFNKTYAFINEFTSAKIEERPELFKTIINYIHERRYYFLNNTETFKPLFNALKEHYKGNSERYSVVSDNNELKNKYEIVTTLFE